jgi:phage N-6-adenine-methyltransferase
MNTSMMFSSETDQWSTPQDFYDEVVWRLGPFSLDVCADSSNAKSDFYFDKIANGLIQPWGYQNGDLRSCWMNPPYGRELGDWIHKACLEAKHGKCVVVCLVPARTDTRWFQEAWDMASRVWFIRGRLKFGNSKNSAPFPSALIELGGGSARQVDYW